MGAILDDGEDPEDAAQAWLKANPEVLDGWLEGVTTLDGGDAVAAVRQALGGAVSGAASRGRRDGLVTAIQDPGRRSGPRARSTG